MAVELEVGARGGVAGRRASAILSGNFSDGGCRVSVVCSRVDLLVESLVSGVCHVQGKDNLWMMKEVSVLDGDCIALRDWPLRSEASGDKVAALQVREREWHGRERDYWTWAEQRKSD